MKEEKNLEYYEKLGDGNPKVYKFLVEEDDWSEDMIERMEDNLDFSNDLKKKDTFNPTGERKLSDGSGTFYVLDETVKKGGFDAEFVKWLRSEGFIYGDKHGFFGGPGIWINLYSKTFAFCMPGVAFAKPVGRCAITSDEFKIIYEIIKSKDEHNL